MQLLYVLEKQPAGQKDYIYSTLSSLWSTQDCSSIKRVNHLSWSLDRHSELGQGTSRQPHLIKHNIILRQLILSSSRFDEQTSPRAPPWWNAIQSPCSRRGSTCSSPVEQHWSNISGVKCWQFYMRALSARGGDLELIVPDHLFNLQISKRRTRVVTITLRSD